jgi:hypothetical protein
MSKKPFVIQCDWSHGKHRADYLMSVQLRRIVQTRWIDSARGFASAAEAQALIDEIARELMYLDLSIINRDEIKDQQKVVS